MDTRIGLFEVKEKAVNPINEAYGHMTFFSHSFTMEYEERMQRLVTPVEISSCVDSAPMFRVRALWDTGAVASCISDKMARKIGLQPIDNGVGVTPAGQIEIQYYFADVHISRDIVIPNARIAGFQLEKHDVDFLIGMDIISKGRLSIDYSKGKTIFMFEIADK